LQEFTVVCTTCQSRIKVRNPNLIGQIVPCPKCSSMVLIENNNRIVLSPQGDAANSQTETKEALGPLPNIKDADKSDGNQNRGRFRADAGNATNATPSGGLGTNTTSNGATSPVPSANVMAKEQDLPDSIPSMDALVRNDWVSAKAKARRQILLVFFLSFSSCIVAVLLFVLFLRNWGDKPTDTLAKNTDVKQPTAAEPAPETKVPESLDIGSNPANLNSGTAGIPNSDSPSQATDMPENPTATEAGAEKEATPSSDDAAAKPPSDDIAMPQAPNVEGESENSPRDTDDTVTEPNVKPANEVATDKLAGNEKTEAADVGATNATAKDAPAPLPESLRKLATIFDPSLEMRLGEVPGSRVQAGLSTPDVAALPIVSSTKLHPPAAAPQDVAKRLSEELAGIEIQERPLCEVLELWSQLSGVGIEIRWNELAAVNVEATDLVSVRMGRTNFQDLLTGVLSPLGLEFVPLDKSLVRIAPLEAKVGELLPQTWKLDDLVTDKSPVAEIDRIIRAINPSFGDLFKITNNEIEWAAAAKPFQKFAVLETLEHLRAMRNVPLASSYKPSLFQRAWPTPNNSSATTTILTQAAVKNAPIVQTLSQSAREVGATFSMDWSGTWEHGLSPYTEETYLPKGRSLSGLADAVALKFGLEVAWLNSNHLLLTTTSRLNHMEMMVHFELSDQRDLESLKRRLSRFSTLSDQDLPSIRFAIDPQSDMLLAVIRPLRSSEVGQRP
jgi:hypothetical protein